jgi:hypothetical protein
MRFTSIVLAAGLLAAPAIALAQSSQAPTTKQAPGRESTAAPSDKVQPPGNVRATPSADSTSNMKMKNAHQGKSRMTNGRGAKPTAVPLDSASGTGKKN